MRTPAREIVVTGLCLMALGLAGCMSPNLRHVQFARVAAHANLTKGVASYYEIEIDKPATTGAPLLVLELPNGQVLDRKSFTYEALKQAGFTSSETEDFQPGKTYSHELSRYGATFYFNYGVLMVLRISTPTTGPGLGFAGERSKQFYHLPLTQEELQRLFGRPDKTKDEFRI